MTNSKREYNEFIRANLPYGITYDSARYQYVTFNGKRFVTYLEAKWYIDYLTKFGGGPEDDIRNDLFGTSEEGVWFEANDATTLFTDVAGTTPVTTPGDAVALQLDKSQGLTLGPELVTNGDFSDGLTGWTDGGTGTSSVSGGQATVTVTTTFATISRSFSTVVGKTYKLSGEIIGTTGNPNFFAIRKSDNANGSINSVNLVTSVTNGSGVFVATSTTTFVLLQVNQDGRSATFDNISVKELPGNHRTQATTAARPLYALHPVGGVRNLLQYTEEFDNVYWTKERLTASGTSLVPTAANGTHNLIRSYSKSGTASNYTVSGRATADGYNFLLFRIDSGAGNGIKVGFNISTGEVSNTAATNGTGWTLLGATITASPDGGYDFSISFTTDATTVVRTIAIVSNTAGDAFSPPSYTGDGTSGIVLEDFQLEQSSTATNYQRVGSFLDVSEEGKARRGRLWYNGTSHFMQTGTITPGTDKVQVFAGVRKLSDAAGMMAELGSLGNFGSFFLISENLYGSASRGDVAASATQRANTEVVSGADSAVITTTHDIPADLTRIKRNGGTYSDATGDKGTGNFLAYPIYFGARAGTSLFYNGYEDTSIIRFGPNLDADTISKVESYVASKTPEPTL